MYALNDPTSNLPYYFKSIYTVPHMEKTQKQLPIAICLVERDGKILITRRVDSEPLWDKKWEFPGGKIDFGETPEQAVAREVLEETGLEIQSPELLGHHTFVWDLPTSKIQVFIFLFRASADKNEVTLSLRENDLYKWVTAKECSAMPDFLEANIEMIKNIYIPYLEMHKSP